MATVGPDSDPGRYRIEEHDGHEDDGSPGGQGIVHRAVLTVELDRPLDPLAAGTRIALKQIEPGAPGERRLAELQEALTNRRHPNLGHQVEVFRARRLPRHPAEDAQASTPGREVTFVASVWVDGATLSAKAKADTVSLTHLLDWFRQVAEALDYLHADLDRYGPLRHRDVKPANIIVTPDDRAVLIDPGVARSGSAQATGTPFGSPGYVPPECAVDTGVDTPAADRWQLAATLVTVLLGRPPDVVGRGQHLHRALTARVAGQVRRPVVFADAVIAMLDPEPDLRPRSAARWVATLLGAATPPLPSERRGRRAGIVAVAVVLGALLGAPGAVASGADGSASGAAHEPASGAARSALVDTRRTSGSTIADQRRAYLSTRPVNFCRALGCEVPGGAVSTGMEVALTCQQFGDEVTNGNDRSPTDDGNPILFTSEVWFGVELADGTRGLLPQVWIHPDDRMARGLPFC